MDALLVTLIACTALLLFVTAAVPVDVTAMGVLVALVVTGVLTAEEAFAGFADEAVLTVAAMFLLTAGLSSTGAVSRVGMHLLRLASSYPRLLLPVILLGITVLSAFINNTAAMAIWLPMALTLARRRRLSPSGLLMPVSFASEWGGLITLIGTSTNIVVHSFLISQGLGGLGMFELAPLGLALSAAGLVYMTFIGRRLLPARREAASLATTMVSRGYLSELVVTDRSPLVGSTLGQARLGRRFDLRVLAVFRGTQRMLAEENIELLAGDVLQVRGDVEELLGTVGFKGLRLHPVHALADADFNSGDLVLVEAMVAPRSWLVGRTARELDFRWRYRAILVAIQRRASLLHSRLRDVPLRLGDTLLLQLHRNDVDRLRRERNLVVLGPAPQQPYRSDKMYLAVAIMAGVVTVNSLDLLPLSVSALLGVGLMVITRCLPYEDMYRAIDWQVILLLGGMFSLGRALEKTGLAEDLAGLVVETLQAWGPEAVLAGMYVLTAVLTQAISNSGSALLMAPVALGAAEQLAVNPRPFLIVVAVAASADFLTPVGYQTNTMVYGPGGYHFLDYARVGWPLTLIFFVLTMLIVPALWTL